MSLNVSPEMLHIFRVHPDDCRCAACGVIQTAIDDDDDMLLNGHWLPPALVQDRECLGLLLHVDQTRSTVRKILDDIPATDLAGLIKRCAAADLGALSEPERRLVGMLATICIFDFKHVPPA